MKELTLFTEPGVAGETAGEDPEEDPGGGLLLATFALWDRYNAGSLRTSGYVLWNVTAKDNGAHPWAPPWDLVRRYREDRISEEEYTLEYGALLHTRGGLGQEFLEKRVFSQKKLALGCYCRPGAFCHRRLLAGWLVGIGEQEPWAPSITWGIRL